MRNFTNNETNEKIQDHLDILNQWLIKFVNSFQRNRLTTHRKAYMLEKTSITVEIYIYVNSAQKWNGKIRWMMKNVNDFGLCF